MRNAEWNRPVEAVGLFRRGHTLRTALPTALAVGTVLCAVNQGAILIAGEASTGNLRLLVGNSPVKSGRKYLLPFGAGRTTAQRQVFSPSSWKGFRPFGAKIHEADSSERRNAEAIRRLRWELCGRLDVA